MPTPDKPTLDYSYTAFQQAQGDNSFPGTQIDNDLANLKQAIDETIDFASVVIRSDGKLQNGSVTKNSLGADVLTGVAAPTVWAAGVSYAVDATVTTDNKLYLCEVAHTSGTFATDEAAGYWAQLAVWSPLTAVADGTISTPKLLDAAVTGPKLASNAVSTAKIADGSVTRAKTAANFGLLPIGATLPWDGPFAPAGWLFKFGQTVSRSTYLDLLNALTAVVIGNATSANNTLTGVSVDLRNLGLEGAPIEGPGVPTGTTIASLTINTITLSQNATAPATSGQYRVFPHGNGDGSTTFTIPDDRDVADIGRGNMGGTARSLVTASGLGNPGFDTTRLGLLGGVDRHALTLVQLPVFTPTGTVLVTYPAHQYRRFNQGSVQLQSGVNANLPTGDGDATTTPPGPVSHSLSLGAIGGGQAHPNVQPSRATNKIIFTGVV